MKLVVFIIKTILTFIYSFLKLLKTKKKITIISRQSNTKTIDIKILEEKLKEQLKDVEVVVLTKKLEGSLFNKFLYCFHMLKQMYHIATSKLVLLDSYCIVISLLKHKKDLKVIQMWHGIGTLKKSGYAILDKEEGSKSKIAHLMKMHHNYDYIFVSANICRKDSVEIFNYDIDKILVYPLPRTDLLTDINYQNDIKNKIYNEYNNLKEKKNIVYAPTFRKDEKELSKAITKLINVIDYDKYDLIIKLHPHSKINITDKRVLVENKFFTTDIFFIADYIIVDYSTVIFEGAILNKPLFFYAFDEDSYINKRDFFIDYHKEMPGLITKSPKKIIKAIENNDYDLKKIELFANKYVELDKNNSTTNIIGFIKKVIKY